MAFRVDWPPKIERMKGFIPFMESIIGWHRLIPRRHADSGNLNVSPSPAEVARHLELLQACAELQACPAELALLNYLVDRTLAGNARQISAYTLAAEVFDRRSDYDPQTDPIVGIRLDRLRRSLDRYYRNAGQNDPLRIDIPQGTFVPIFTNHSPSD